MLAHLVFAYPPVNCRIAHPICSCDLVDRQLIFLPFCDDFADVRREILARTTELHATLLRSGDTFSLALLDRDALILSDEAQQLQNQIADECAEQILIPPCIQQRHIQYNHLNAFFAGDDAPLFLDFLVVSPQPVDALDVQCIAVPQFFQQPLIIRAVEILAGQLVDVDILFPNAASFIARSWRSSFWSNEETRTYAYVLLFIVTSMILQLLSAEKG